MAADKNAVHFLKKSDKRWMNMLAEYRREIRCSSEDLSDAEIRAVQISFLVLNEKRHREVVGVVRHSKTFLCKI